MLGITLLGILVGIFFTTFAKPIVYLLYTKKYAPSIPCLSILIWSTSFAMIGTARGVWIVAERYNKFAKYLTLTGCFFNLVTNAIVIPHYGIIGASFTTLLSQMLVALVSPLFFKETRPFVKLYLGSFGQFPKLFQTIKGIVKK